MIRVPYFRVHSFERQDVLLSDDDIDQEDAIETNGPDSGEGAVAGPKARTGLPQWALITVVAVAVGLVGFLAGWTVSREPGDDRHERSEFEGRGPGDGSRMPFGGPEGGISGPRFGRDGEMPEMPGRGGADGALPELRRAVLGVVVSPGTGDGIVVMRVVPGGPADEAGLEVKDVITKVDDVEVADPAALIKAIGAHKAGDEVVITVKRDGETKTLTVKLIDVSDIQSRMNEAPAEPARSD